MVGHVYLAPGVAIDSKDEDEDVDVDIIAVDETTGDISGTMPEEVCRELDENIDPKAVLPATEDGSVVETALGAMLPNDELDQLAVFDALSDDEDAPFGVVPEASDASAEVVVEELPAIGELAAYELGRSPEFDGFGVEVSSSLEMDDCNDGPEARAELVEELVSGSADESSRLVTEVARIGVTTAVEVAPAGALEPAAPEDELVTIVDV